MFHFLRARPIVRDPFPICVGIYSAIPNAAPIFSAALTLLVSAPFNRGSTAQTRFFHLRESHEDDPSCGFFERWLMTPLEKKRQPSHDPVYDMLGVTG